MHILAAKVRRMLDDAHASRFTRPALVAAIVVFIGGLALSLQQLPDALGQIAPSFLVLSALFAIPAAIALNAVETKLCATLAGAHFGWLQATYIGLVSSAANLLPLPGGPLVRIAALKRAGVSLVQSGVATTLVAVAGFGIALTCAGASIFISHPAVATPFLAAGGIATLASAIALARLGHSWLLVTFVLAAKTVGIAVGLLRMYWALASLGLLVSLTQLYVFAVSDVAGSVISIVPAGLGVNEAVAALMASLVSVPPPVAFLAVSLNRVIALPVLALATAFVAGVRTALERQNGGISA